MSEVARPAWLPECAWNTLVESLIEYKDAAVRGEPLCDMCFAEGVAELIHDHERRHEHSRASDLPPRPSLN